MYSVYPIEKSNPKIVMSKSDIMMFVEEKKVFYYFNNLLCKHHVFL
jgi:hypothetical protein